MSPGIPKNHRVAESVAERLAIGAALYLELLAHGAVLVPSVRKLTIAVAHFLEPRLPVREQPAADAPGDTDPFLAVIGDDFGNLVIAALRAADLVGDVADIDNAAGVKLRPVIDDENDVRPRPRLYCRGDPCLNVVGIDRLKSKLYPERFVALGYYLAPEQLIGSGHAIRPA